MFDVTNSKSFANLRKWIREIVEAHREHPIDSTYSSRRAYRERPGDDNDRRSATASKADLGRMPIFIVGCKLDIDDRKKPHYDELYNTIKTMGIEHAFVTSAPGHTFNRGPILDFIDQVVAYRYRSVKEATTSAALRHHHQLDRTQTVVTIGGSAAPRSGKASPFGWRSHDLHSR